MGRGQGTINVRDVLLQGSGRNSHRGQDNAEEKRKQRAALLLVNSLDLLSFDTVPKIKGNSGYNGRVILKRLVPYYQDEGGLDRLTDNLGYSSKHLKEDYKQVETRESAVGVQTGYSLRVQEEMIALLYSLNLAERLGARKEEAITVVEKEIEASRVRFPKSAYPSILFQDMDYLVPWKNRSEQGKLFTDSPQFARMKQRYNRENNHKSVSRTMFGIRTENMIESFEIFNHYSFMKNLVQKNYFNRGNQTDKARKANNRNTVLWEKTLPALAYRQIEMLWRLPKTSIPNLESAYYTFLNEVIKAYD